MDIGSAGSLVVIADLEVAGGSVQGIGAERLCCTAVDADTEDIVGVADGVGEGLTNGNIANSGDDLITTGASLLDAHGKDTTGVVVQLAYWLRAGVVVNVDLTDDGTVAGIVGLLNSQRHRQLVVGAVGAPAAGVAFTQLRTAVLAVGRGDTASV